MKVLLLSLAALSCGSLFAGMHDEKAARLEAELNAAKKQHQDLTNKIGRLTEEHSRAVTEASVAAARKPQQTLGGVRAERRATRMS